MSLSKSIIHMYTNYGIIRARVSDKVRKPIRKSEYLKSNNKGKLIRARLSRERYFIAVNDQTGDSVNVVYRK